MTSRNIFLVGLLSILFSPTLLSQESGLINLGASVGGSGAGGVVVQLKPVEKLVFEFGVYGRLAHVDVFESRWLFAPAMDANLSVYIRKKKKEQSDRVIADGIYLRGAMGLRELEEAMAGIGWVREFYSEKRPRQFWQLQLGPSLIHRTETYMNTRYPPDYQEQSETWFSGMIYTRLSWFFVAK